MTAGSTPGSRALLVNGWSIYAHPLFLNQLDELAAEVEKAKRRDPSNYRSRNCTKRLAAITKLVMEIIPSDPASPQFRQGTTLGNERKHWFRAKFFQQYRLFFRFDSTNRIIVFAWVNDEQTLRAYGNKTDAYATFRRMLDEGDPPDDFAKLLQATRTTPDRFAKTMKTRR